MSSELKYNTVVVLLFFVYATRRSQDASPTTPARSYGGSREDTGVSLRRRSSYTC